MRRIGMVYLKNPFIDQMNRPDPPYPDTGADMDVQLF